MANQRVQYQISTWFGHCKYWNAHAFIEPMGFFFIVSFVNLHGNSGLLFSPSTKSCNLSQGMTATSFNLRRPPPCDRIGLHNMSSFLNGPGGGFCNIPLISSRSTRSLSGSYGGSWGSVFASMVRSTFELSWACLCPGLHVRVVRESSWVWGALWLPWEHPLISTVRSIYTWFLPSIVSTIGKKWLIGL